jgi:para-aminobenzoate synthetase
VVDPATLPPELVPIAWTCAGHHAVTLQRDATAAAAPPSSSAAAQMNDHQQQPADSTTVASSSGGGGEAAPILMALAHATRPHFGVQFHPESVATRFGVQLLANFRDLVARHYGRPAAAPPADGLGPPGRCLAPRAWPGAARGLLDDQQQEKPSSRPQRRSISGWDDDCPPACSGPRAASAALGPATAATRLRLVWRKVAGALEAAGGGQALFEALAGPNGGEDVFWLDRWALRGCAVVIVLIL